MKIQSGLLGCVVFIGFLCTSVPAEAYVTTAQSARVLNNHTVLFTITYRFGVLRSELLMPISTVRTASTSDRGTLGYSFKNTAGENVTTGTSTGLVLSNAAIKDGQYYLPKGKAADFSLVTVLTVPAGMNPDTYALHVSSLPFVMIEGGVKYPAQLNPSELQYYVTPRVTIPQPVGTTQLLEVTTRTGA